MHVCMCMWERWYRRINTTVDRLIWHADFIISSVKTNSFSDMTDEYEATFMRWCILQLY